MHVGIVMGLALLLVSSDNTCTLTMCQWHLCVRNVLCLSSFMSKVSFATKFFTQYSRASSGGISELPLFSSRTKSTLTCLQFLSLFIVECGSLARGEMHHGIPIVVVMMSPWWLVIMCHNSLVASFPTSLGIHHYDMKFTDISRISFQSYIWFYFLMTVDGLCHFLLVPAHHVPLMF